MEDGEPVNIVPGGIAYMDYSEGVSCGSNVFVNDCYQGELAGGIPSTYHQLPTNSFVEHAYRCNFQKNSERLLRHQSMALTNNNQIIFSEQVDCDFKSWLKSHVNNLMDGGSLDRGFIRIIRDILEGMIFYWSKESRAHADIGRNSIFISNGRAKLGGGSEFVENIVVDREAFVRLFKDVKVGSDDFGPFLDFVKNSNQDSFPYALHHPVLLSCKGRCLYREATQSMLIDVRQLQNFKRELMNFIDDYPRQIREIMNFVEFSSNKSYHLAMSYTSIDQYLNQRWIGFLGFLHDVMAASLISVDIQEW